ncbi:MAG: glucokinase, partial [Octadecabacter sp.]
MTHPANTLSLVADIGGTNTRCALTDGRHVLPDTVRRYANTDFTGREAVLRQYLSAEGYVNPAADC